MVPIHLMGYLNKHIRANMPGVFQDSSRPECGEFLCILLELVKRFRIELRLTGIAK